jgi:putative transposase
VTPSAKREAVAVLAEVHGLSVRRACRVVRLARAAYYRPPPARLVQDQPVIDALHAVVAESSKWGFWKCFDRLQNLGHPWNHKRVYRVYRALRLNLPRRTRRRIPRRVQHPLAAPAKLNHIWALDFMGDALYDGRSFRTCNILDEGNREGLAIEVGRSLPSVRVIALLDDLVALHGKPYAIRVDNGPELTSIALTRWCAQRGIKLLYIQPGKPQQNAYIERFNRTYRTEVLVPQAFRLSSRMPASASSSVGLSSMTYCRRSGRPRTCMTLLANSASKSPFRNAATDPIVERSRCV